MGQNKSKSSDKGFLSYFINPGSARFKYKDLDFVVVPKSKYYNSYIDLCRKTNNQCMILK